MKNQYFGDINDYRKYGLLRALIRSARFRVLVAWMLTPDDGSSDGSFIGYLDSPAKWKAFDPDLFTTLGSLMALPCKRAVSLIEPTNIIPEAQFYSREVPDQSGLRTQWFKALLQESEDCDFLFLDPDNGIEVKSVAYGRRRSSKYLYWREIEELWSSGKSLLIYQHFIREKRSVFIERMLESLSSACPGALVEAFSTSHVVFLMALQPEHQSRHTDLTNAVQAQWHGQISHWELTRQSS